MVFIFVIFLAFATCIDFSSGPLGFSKYTGILNLEFQVFGILFASRDPWIVRAPGNVLLFEMA